MTSKTAFSRFLLGIGFVIFGAVPLATAQTPLSPDRVTFYSEPNFKGDALTVEAGAGVDNLESLRRPNGLPWTFAISSVRVEGVAKAIVYTAAGLHGDRLEITRSIVDLYGERRSQDAGATWDRSIVSVSVIGPGRVVVAPPPGPSEPPPTTVIVVPAPPPPPARPALSLREAELIVQRAYRDVLDRSADSDGLRRYRDRLMQDGWSEHQVIEALQRSEEARAINADEAITRLFRDTLGRDPDPSGLNTYRQRWHDGWTQGKIRDDLLHSKEGRDVFAKNVITRAYKELLGRDPDPAGFATYERNIRERSWDERQVREALMKSEEYRQRQKHK